MKKIVEGSLDGAGLKVGIVVSRFNNFISDRLLEGAIDGLKRNGVKDEDIIIAKTPGSFELPVIAKKLATSGKVDGVICLGAIVRGNTPHFDFIASEVTKGVAMVGLETKIPVTYGVITTDNIEQAVERAGTKMGNKGFDAALALIEQANLFKQLT